MSAKVYEVTNGFKIFSGFGDSAEEVAKKLLRQAREYTGEAGASEISLYVGFDGGDETFIGSVTVAE